MDLDPVGADLSGESQLTLNPGSGLDPTRQVKYIPTAATAVFPNVAAPLYASVETSGNVMPKTPQALSVVPVVSNDVSQLQAPNPLDLSPQAQQRATDFSAQSRQPQGEQQGPVTRGGPQGPVPVRPDVEMMPTAQQQVRPPEQFQPDPNLLMAKKKLQESVDWAEKEASSGFNELWFGPAATNKLKEEAAQKRLQIRQIDEAIQKQRDIQATGANAGVSAGPHATPETIIQKLVEDYKSGEPSRAKKAEDALTAAGRTDLIKGYQQQAIAAMGGTIREQSDIRQKLDTATTDDAYNRMRTKLQKRADAVGFTIPKSLGEWENPKQRAVRLDAERRAMVMLDQHETQIAEQTDYTPETNKDLEASYAAKATYPDNTPVYGSKGVAHKGFLTNGGQLGDRSHIITDYGRTWDTYTSGEKGAQKDIENRMEVAFPRTEREKHVTIARAIKMATTDPNTGQPMTDEATKNLINDQPNVQQAIAEALAAALRGGAGGANGYLMRLELAKRGWAQGTLDKLVTEWAGTKGAITGKQAHYLTKVTQGQIRYVLDFLQNYNTKDIGGRLGAVAERAGIYGAKAENLPIEDELKGILRNRVEVGRDMMIQHMGRQYRVIGDQNSTFVGTGAAAAAVPGAVRTPVPASALPALYPELQAPPPPPPPAPAAAPSVAPGSGGGPAAPGTTPLAPKPGSGGGPTFGAGATPVPYAPIAPAQPAPAPTGAGGALRPLAATPAAAAIQALAPQPQPQQVAQAQLPSSWGAGMPAAPAGTVAAPRVVLPGGPQAAVPTPQAPGGPGTSTTPPAVAAPAGNRGGGTFTQGVPSGGFPAKIADNPVARTVFGVAGQTAQNATQGKNPNSAIIANNSAIVAASSAASESGYRPNELHDGGRGYGLFGHNGDRLRQMHELNGNQPGPIPPNVQAAFYTREMSRYADADPFIARTLANPDASAEDLTRVQVRLEQPKGYKGPGTEEQASGWANRLAHTRELMGSAGVQGTAQTAAQPVIAAAPPPLAAPSASLLNPRNALQSVQQAAARVPAAETFQNAPNYAPAALGTVGAVTGGVVAGPPGAYYGGVIGGGLGGYIKNRYGPEENRTLSGAALDVGLGGAEGLTAAIPGAKPAAMAARTVLSTIIPGFEAYMGNKDAGQVFDAAVWGGLGGAAGETFGKALGAAGNAMWGSYSKATQQQMMAVGKTLAEQEPKIMNSAGKMVENPVHTAAVDRAKQLGQDPDNLKHAWKTAEENVTRNAKGGVEVSSARIPPNVGEALTQRPGQVEAMRLQREQLNPMKDEVHAAGGKLLPRPGTFMHDPTNIVGVHSDVPNTQIMRDAAAAAKVQMNQPANSWREIWDNQVKARAKMLVLEREAPGKQQGKAAAEGFRALADEVRAQQEHIVRTLMPPKKADAFMQRLDVVDNAYRKAKVAGGEDIVQVIHAGGTKGREAQAAFNELAKNDDSAKAMMANLLRLHTGTGRAKEAGKYGGLGTAMYVASHVPVVGHTAMAGLGMVGGFKMMKDYIILRGAGATVKFSDLVRHNMSAAKIGKMQAGANVLGAAAGPTVGEATGLSEGTRELPRVYIQGEPNTVPPQ